MDCNAVCEWCGKSDGLLRCSKCRSAYYCSKEHQCQDWQKHKRLCRLKSKLSCNSTNQQGPSANASKSIASSNIKGFRGTTSVVVDQKSKISKSEAAEISIGRNTSPITFEGSSENEILNARTENLNPTLALSDMSSPSLVVNNKMSKFPEVPLRDEYSVLGLKNNRLELISEIRLDNDTPSLSLHGKVEQEIVDTVFMGVIRDMNEFGVCVVDEFLGKERGMAVLNEVIGMYQKGVFKDGQLVSNRVSTELKNIRGDQITWIDGKEPFCTNIGMLISIVDAIIMKANRYVDNGKMGQYNINGRTKVS